jgi:hypothetical protein
MRSSLIGGAIALPLIFAACADPGASTAPAASLAASSAEANGVAALANGSYQYAQPLPASLGGGSVNFTVEMNTVIGPDGAARGSFRHTATIQGLAYDIAGDVTCAATDDAFGRAWIGGVVTVNNSTHPSFSGPINQVGKDAWFRVADLGNGQSGTADRSTTLGFEGGGGIITSAQYCDMRIWPNNANEVVTGNLMVK